MIEKTYEELIEEYYLRLDGHVFPGDKGHSPLGILLSSLLNRESDILLEDAKRNALKIKERYEFTSSEFRSYMKEITYFFDGEYLFHIDSDYQIYSYAVNEYELEDTFYQDMRDIKARMNKERFNLWEKDILSRPLEERIELLGYGFLVMCYPNDDFSPHQNWLIDKLLAR